MSGKRPRAPAPPSPSGFCLEHIPFCTQDVLPVGAFDQSVRRIGMIPEERVKTHCWFCGKAPAAPMRCPNCDTGIYCGKECALGDVEVHSRYCKLDGKFYWPPAPRVVQQ